MIVYGVFIKNRCIYVGCTSSFERRSKPHERRFSKLFDETPEIKILNRVAPQSADYAEWSMIRMYKDLGQADFNSEPGLIHSPHRMPRAQRLIERSRKILELVRNGHPRKEIALTLGVQESEISHVCIANGIRGIRGRKKWSGVGYGIKLTRAQHEEILRRDERNVSHAEIGKLFGVSRERVRQICAAAGHPTRRERQRQEIEARKQRRREEIEASRQRKRLTPTARTLRVSELWHGGRTIREITALMGRENKAAMAVDIVRLRNRFPVLFPYRRPENLRWKGKNLRQLKQAA